GHGDNDGKRSRPPQYPPGGAGGESQQISPRSNPREPVDEPILLFVEPSARVHQLRLQRGHGWITASERQIADPEEDPSNTLERDERHGATVAPPAAFAGASADMIGACAASGCCSRGR